MDPQTTGHPIITLVIQGFIALGTVAVAILAIWGDWVRSRRWTFAGPKLEIALHEKGVVTSGRDGTGRDFFRHIKIVNKRQWNTARHVAIMCTAIEKKVVDGTFMSEPWVVPLQLIWSGPFHEQHPNVRKEETCDLGIVGERGTEFGLRFYHPQFPLPTASIQKGQAMRVSLKACADNFTSPQPYVIEISWDGKWTDNLEETQKHLVIKKM